MVIYHLVEQSGKLVSWTVFVSCRLLLHLVAFLLYYIRQSRHLDPSYSTTIQFRPYQGNIGLISWVSEWIVLTWWHSCWCVCYAVGQTNSSCVTIASTDPRSEMHKKCQKNVHVVSARITESYWNWAYTQVPVNNGDLFPLYFTRIISKLKYPTEEQSSTNLVEYRADLSISLFLVFVQVWSSSFICLTYEFFVVHHPASCKNCSENICLLHYQCIFQFALLLRLYFMHATHSLLALQNHSCYITKCYAQLNQT